MDVLQALTDQVINLSWLRCCIEQGIDFVNKKTGQIEDNEVTIYKHLSRRDGTFDVPDVQCGPARLEKNVLEVVGNMLVNTQDPNILKHIHSSGFSAAVRQVIEKIRNHS